MMKTTVFNSQIIFDKQNLTSKMHRLSSFNKNLPVPPSISFFCLQECLRNRRKSSWETVMLHSGRYYLVALILLKRVFKSSVVLVVRFKLLQQFLRKLYFLSKGACFKPMLEL